MLREAGDLGAHTWKCSMVIRKIYFIGKTLLLSRGVCVCVCVTSHANLTLLISVCHVSFCHIDNCTVVYLLYVLGQNDGAVVKLAFVTPQQDSGLCGVYDQRHVG